MFLKLDSVAEKPKGEQKSLWRTAPEILTRCVAREGNGKQSLARARRDVGVRRIALSGLIEHPAQLGAQPLDLSELLLHAVEERRLRLDAFVN